MTAPNIVLCFDGTGNEFDSNNTNVVRLIQSMDRRTQHMYYDPGVGTMPEPTMLTSAGKKASELAGLAFGAGLVSNVTEAYRFLMDWWEPGSRIYIFGFSRGAYTARVLAGLLHCLGLIPHGNSDLVNYAMRIFKSLRGDKTRKRQDEHWQLCNEFRNTFARETGAKDRRFEIHFLGLWDTVSSYGYAWDPQAFPFTAKNPSVTYARHAIAIDERRAFFRQNRLNPVDGQDWQEAWFPGVHSDIGGGYPAAESRLWLVAYDWMMEEADSKGLAIDSVARNSVRAAAGSVPVSPWLETKHESLEGKWKFAEWYPKKHWNSTTNSFELRMNRGRYRTIHDGELIHRSAIERLHALPEYRPQNISADFVRAVSHLSAVPALIPYAADGNLDREQKRKTGT